MLFSRSVLNSGAAEKVITILQSVKASIPEAQVYSPKAPSIPPLELIQSTPKVSSVSKEKSILKDPRLFIMASIGAFLVLKSTKSVKEITMEVTKEVAPATSSFLKEFFALVSKNV